MTNEESTDFVCLVTGAGSGIGRAMALGLLRTGHKVAALDVNKANLTATADAAGDAAVRLLTLVVDIRREDECAHAVAQAHVRLGGVQMLVNCAGLGMSHVKPDYLRSPARFWEIDAARWRDLMEVNVNGGFLMARAVTPYLITQRFGRIVNVTTSFSTMIRGGNMPYGATKAALEAASNAWAQDLAGTGVTVNVLIPGGAADTAMIPFDSPYERTKLIDPEVLVAPICWLASSQSDGVTGLRIVAKNWGPNEPWESALRASSAPIAWPDLGNEALKTQPRSAGALKV